MLSLQNPNLGHYDALLDAELLSLLDGTSKNLVVKVHDHFEKAIRLSARRGFTQMQALATERFGEYYLRQEGDKQSGAFQIQKAIQLYGIWGAQAKVDRMNIQYVELLKSSLG